MRLLVALAASTAGVQGILQRRLPNHVDDSTFSLVNTSITTTSSSSSSSNNNNTTFLSKPQDQYTVLNGPNPGQIHISGTSPNRPRHQSPLVPHHLLPRGPLVVVTQHPNSGSSVVALALPTSTPVTLSRIRHPLVGGGRGRLGKRESDSLGSSRGQSPARAGEGYEKVFLEVLVEAGVGEGGSSGGGGKLPAEGLDRRGSLGLQKKIEVYLDARVVSGSRWNGFPERYTNVTFLEPFDPLFRALAAKLPAQHHLDQMIASLKAADPQAIWLPQGWLFYSSANFWTNDCIAAYLGGVADADLLILDLFSESQPQWQRTSSLHGKSWIWCQLHDYGGNMGLYGQVENVTADSIMALGNQSSTMVGMGLTMEGQEGYEPEVLVEAWKQFYAAADGIPGLWENDEYRFNLTDITRQVMANGFYPLYTTFITASNTSQPSTYNITTARHTGKDLLRLLGDIDTILTASGIAHFSLPAWIASARAWADPTPLFSTTRPSMNHSPPSINTTAVTDRANFYEYNARNQITLWGPRGEISDYASKQWGGLIGSYYLPRWEMFVNSTLNGNEGSSMPFASSSAGDEGLVKELEDFELEWQGRRWGGRLGEGFEVVGRDALQREMGRVVEGWAGVFGV
ncbi:hypothetical protein KC332_g8002 [Hortaea werneckii]|nr:hypothetical protein KC332_g8002 [Hortaea werneckii]